MNLAIDIISDVICPWCWIGKRRLEKAIAVFDRKIEVRWLPFQLNPTMPKDGISRRDYRIKKFGSWERSLDSTPRLPPLARRKDSTSPLPRWNARRTP